MIKKRKNPSLKAEKLAENIIGGHVIFIGEGIDGEVYNYQNKYAIKILRRSIKKDLDLYIKYVMSLSDHKLIPKIYDVGENFIVMQYIDSLSLKEILFRLSKKDRLRIYREIEKELQKWHHLGFTHGDLNTKNVLILPNKILFIDFIDRPDLVRLQQDENWMKILLNSNIENDLKDLKQIKREMAI